MTEPSLILEEAADILTLEGWGSVGGKGVSVKLPKPLKGSPFPVT